jgi:hypothetical protein
MMSCGHAGNPASARKYFPSGIYRSLERASSYIHASAADPSQPVRAYTNLRSKEHPKRQF